MHLNENVIRDVSLQVQRINKNVQNIFPALCCIFFQPFTGCTTMNEERFHTRSFVARWMVYVSIASAVQFRESHSFDSESLCWSGVGRMGKNNSDSLWHWYWTYMKKFGKYSQAIPCWASYSMRKMKKRKTYLMFQYFLYSFAWGCEKKKNCPNCYPLIGTTTTAHRMINTTDFGQRALYENINYAMCIKTKLNEEEKASIISIYSALVRRTR